MSRHRDITISPEWLPGTAAVPACTPPRRVTREGHVRADLDEHARQAEDIRVQVEPNLGGPDLGHAARKEFS